MGLHIFETIERVFHRDWWDPDVLGRLQHQLSQLGPAIFVLTTGGPRVQGNVPSKLGIEATESIQKLHETHIKYQ